MLLQRQRPAIGRSLSEGQQFIITLSWFTKPKNHRCRQHKSGKIVLSELHYRGCRLVPKEICQAGSVRYLQFHHYNLPACCMAFCQAGEQAAIRSLNMGPCGDGEQGGAAMPTGSRLWVIQRLRCCLEQVTAL